MKPDWKDAPEWANWLARDSDGLWSWHEMMPKPGVFFDVWVSGGLYDFAGTGVRGLVVLEARP